MKLSQVATAVSVALCASLPVHAATVLANNPAPGDAFVNAGPTNMGQAVGASGWYYNNVRNSGSVGISTALPRSGNGSAAMSGPANAKADIEFLPGAVAVGGNWFSTASMGSFGSLTALSYEWYRDAASTADAHLHPVIRVLLDADGNLATTGDRGGLVFERVYNGGGVAAGSWTADAVGAATNVWNFGLGLGFAFDIGGDGYAYDDTLAEWQAFLPSAVVIGISSGIGSGWGPFSGAVDNIAWAFGTAAGGSANFEVDAAVVPLPASGWLVLPALLALGLRRRG